MDEQKVSEQEMVMNKRGMSTTETVVQLVNEDKCGKAGSIDLNAELDLLKNECSKSDKLADVSQELDDTDSINWQSLDDMEPSPKKQKLSLTCDWPNCKKVFHKRRYLEDHIRSHTGEVSLANL